VPAGVGDFLILRAVRVGRVRDRGQRRGDRGGARRRGRDDGLLLCPRAPPRFAAYEQSLAEGRVSTDDRVVLFNCGNGLKYPMPPVGSGRLRSPAVGGPRLTAAPCEGTHGAEPQRTTSSSEPPDVSTTVASSPA
jgi:hypothetical protein